MEKQRRNTIRTIMQMKEMGEPIACLTAYDFPTASRMDSAGIDLILVGDSVGMAVYGMDSTVPVTLEMMINHGEAVARAAKKALVVVDMPFGSYQESPQQAFNNAARIMKETGCQAVKLEGGQEMAETVSFLTRRGIPVMGHIGLQPQSVNAVGGYRVAGRDPSGRKKLLKDAEAIQRSEAFSLVIECTEEPVAREITETLKIPTIGIGASAACDGQILVVNDMLGVNTDYMPKLAKAYVDLASACDQAFSRYIGEVKARQFPGPDQTYAARKPDIL